MQPEVVLIQRPAIDFATFLGLSHKATGVNLASAADASARKIQDPERFLSCLARMGGEKASALVPNVLAHVSFSAFIAADEYDLLDILACTSGMPFAIAETVARGVLIAVLTGTINQWRDAVKSGTAPSSRPGQRACFSKVLSLFEREGLAHVWNDFSKREAPDRIGFYLEDKRK